MSRDVLSSLLPIDISYKILGDREFFYWMRCNNMTFHFEGNCAMGDDELFFNLTLNLYKKILVYVYV